MIRRQRASHEPRARCPVHTGGLQQGLLREGLRVPGLQCPLNGACGSSAGSSSKIHGTLDGVGQLFVAGIGGIRRPLGGVGYQAISFEAPFRGPADCRGWAGRQPREQGIGALTAGLQTPEGLEIETSLCDDGRRAASLFAAEQQIFEPGLHRLPHVLHIRSGVHGARLSLATHSRGLGHVDRPRQALQTHVRSSHNDWLPVTDARVVSRT